MTQAKLNATVGPGMFKSERSVRVTAVSGVQHCLVTDENNTDAQSLRVSVKWASNGVAVVQLPASTFSGVNQVMVPLSDLEYVL